MMRVIVIYFEDDRNRLHKKVKFYPWSYLEYKKRYRGFVFCFWSAGHFGLRENRNRT